MEEPPQIKVLIVDDEPAAHARLEDLLRKEEDIEIVGQVKSGREAVRALKTQAVDLVFLDVQMPGLTGLEVVDEIGPARMPMVIFVTAYDQFALKAFDHAAVDYLLKPFNDDRFEQSLARVRQALKFREVDLLQNRLTMLVEQIASQAQQPAPPYLKRIAVEMRGQKRIVPVERVDYILARGPYAELHVGKKKYLLSEQMQTLEKRLHPEQFLRIHRSTIVQLNRIETLTVGAGGDYAVCLTDGRHFKVSRRRWDTLVERLGLGSQNQ